VGSSVVTLICQVLLLIMTYRATRHLVHFSIPWKFIGSFLFLGGLSMAISFGLASALPLSEFLELVLSVVVFGAIYGIPLVWLLYKDHAKSLESIV